MHMYIDLVGTCNLSCPSCPIGNSENNNYKKAISFDLMDKITSKAKMDGVKSIYMYNWTEPLLHNKIGDFVRMIEDKGMTSGISSNLNITKNIDEAISANPSFFRISLSGFNQDTYQKGHAGGNIELVKSNMRLLGELKKKYSAKTIIEVYFHRYLDNISEEPAMRQFAEDLGFRFSSAFATMMPLEKTLAIAEGNEEFISDKDRKVLGRIALPPTGETLALSKKMASLPCNLRDEMLTLDCAGNAVLCCTVFDQKKYNVGSYIELSLAEITIKKNSLPNCTEMCNRCMNNGLHVYAQHSHTSRFEEIAVGAALAHHLELLKGIPESITLTDGERVTKDGFDELGYLANNPDVARAVSGRQLTSGYEHFYKFGQYEERHGWRRNKIPQIMIPLGVVSS